MASLNQVSLIGYVGEEPRAVNGASTTTLRLATTEKGYKKQDGTTIPDRTEWHNIVAFGKLADIAKTFVHKGSQLFIQGKIRTRSYEDKNKQQRYFTEIVADVIQLLDRATNGSSVTTEGKAVKDSRDDLPF